MNRGIRRFVGFGKEKNGYINAGLLIDELLLLPRNEKGYIFITLGKHKEIREKGITHWVAEDTYKPPNKE